MENCGSGHLAQGTYPQSGELLHHGWEVVQARQAASWPYNGFDQPDQALTVTEFSRFETKFSQEVDSLELPRALSVMPGFILF